MTTQAPDFGTDIFCDPATEDADDLFSEVSGVALVKQDLRHRLTTDSVLPSPEGDDDGYDLRKLLGATAGNSASYQARVKRVVLKDQRIASATVDITETDTGKGMRTITVDINGKTAIGPFRLVFLLDPSQSADEQVTIMRAQ